MELCERGGLESSFVFNHKILRREQTCFRLNVTASLYFATTPFDIYIGTLKFSALLEKNMNKTPG